MGACADSARELGIIVKSTNCSYQNKAFYGAFPQIIV